MAEQLPTNKNIKSELGMESSSFKPVIIADLNVDPPETDEDDTTLVSASLLTSGEDKSSLMCKDNEVTEGEGKKLSKLGRCRSRISKLEYPLDDGADVDGDQHSQGVSTSREEKVSSLKTGLVHVARKMPKNAHAHFILGLMYQRLSQPQKAVLAYEKAAEILLRSEEEIDRPELLSLVQIHHAQVH